MEFHKKIAEMSNNKFYLDSLEMVFQSTYNIHFKIVENLEYVSQIISIQQLLMQ